MPISVILRKNNLKKHLEASPIRVAKLAHKKLERVILKNTGLETIYHLYQVLSGKNISISFPINFTTELIPHYKYVPLTSCDVERTFSMYKHILSDKRHSLSVDNIEKNIFC
jgi:hypothetical protein